MMKREEEKKAKGIRQRAKGEEQRAEGKAQSAKGEEQRAKRECGTTDNNLPVSQFDNLTNEISTVFQIKKPSVTETRFPAEGCISEPQAIRACLIIRVFNN
jgi:hypothetical protein